MASDATTTVNQNLYDTLRDRGFVAQCTDERIQDRLSKPVVAYCGFDPTADSLHVGSLVPIMGLAHLQQAGHQPLVVVGGATALVGDPSGKTEARQMLSREQIATNAQAIAKQIGQVVRFDDSPTGAVLLNNADWLADKNWIAMLREVGPHFSVNRMLSMDSVKSRLDAGGLSFLEFNYMIMQAYDFWHLNQTHGCTLQLGGQDQWGNIVMGIELARRVSSAELAGLTLPLVTKADGGKFGKTESGNVWLDANRTSPYDFYQFWRNVSDADVVKFLCYFTFLPMDEIKAMTAEGGAALNGAKARLAYEVTKLIHGEDEAKQADESAKKAFSASADVTGDAIPHAAIAAAELDSGAGLLDLMKQAGLTQSNSEARRLVAGGGVRIHDQVVDDPMRQVTSADVTDGYVLVRVGKKRMFRWDVG